MSIRRTVFFTLLCFGCGREALPEHGLDAVPAPVDALTQELWQSGPGAATEPPAVTLTSGGAYFRVWAPDARAVAVAGDFNGWDMQRHTLQHIGGGTWGGFVAGARAWQRYKYVITSRFGATFWKTDPRAARVENSDGAAVIHDPDFYYWRSSFQMPPWNELVAYELHLGTFSGDSGRPGGFRSATAHLDHLADLGVNLIELMPASEFAGDQSWGYNPSYPFAPESGYGTPEDFKHLIDEAHARGIAVVLDVVHNHYGPSDLSMWCFTGDCLGNGGHYFYTDDRASTPWGRTRPDYGRSDVREFIKANARMWLGEYRLDGLRWDATRMIRTFDGHQGLTDGADMLRAMNWESRQDFPAKLMIAEDMAGEAFVTRPTSEGGLGFGSQWDAGFVHTLRAAVTSTHDGDRSMTAVKDAIARNFNGAATQRVIYTENHDESANGRSRLPEEIAPGQADNWFARKRSMLAAAVTLTSPGIPMLFQGQEFLESGYFSDDRKLDWSKYGRHAAVRQFYKDLIRLRRNWHNQTRGLTGEHVNVFHVNEQDKVLAYHRWQGGGAGDDVVVIANFSNRTFPSYALGLPREGLWRVRFNSDAKAYGGDFGATPAFDFWATSGGMDGLGQHGTVGLGPYSVLILSQ